MPGSDLQCFPQMMLACHLKNMLHYCFGDMGILVACMYAAWCLDPMETRKGMVSPGTGITDSCEPPCGRWELNPGPLEEQPVL